MASTTATRSRPGIVATPVLALARALGASILGDRDLDEAAHPVTGVQQDSRRVIDGDLFVALAGAHADGARHAPAAVERGAAAVLCGRGHGATLVRLGVPILEIDEPRRAMAKAAAILYGSPMQRLTVTGITGTNGKTTTAHLIVAAIEACHGRAGIVGTLGHRFEGAILGEGHTSPEADELQRIAGEMRALGATHLVMEVSSIALVAERVAEVSFRVAAFTNLTQDHLDYHGSMEAYAAAKDSLFLPGEDARHGGPSVSVINIDDAHGRRLAGRLRDAGAAVLRYSIDPNSEAEVKPRALTVASEGTAIRLFDTDRTLSSPLVGAHNASNLLCAVAVARALGLDEATALGGIAGVTGVPGRLERCDQPGHDDVVAVVDYAHTPDALVRVLASVRPLTQGRLWCVFGCGGDRDPHKRAPMGEAVAHAADAILVTNDNPRSEPPEEIARAIVTGLDRAGANGRYRVVLERRQAIAHAVAEAASGDVVLVAGKGHEPYQIIGTHVHAFDDRDELRAALLERRRRRGGT
ncbi:MAG: UDP-N-acetylmuramoyl-L-alanyl-D-glutamate--2,6-diaminopimelate ligase [Myxococcales bacterium]|nr:UDP-N-acetylmuramoyl-L-alanyl-D-glutamate--2,6-diaminopimelate ligase [Myxococcales bacterium]